MTLKPSIRGALLAALLVVLGGITIWPIWSCDYPPLTDYPEHVAAIAVWAHFGDPAYGYSDVFAIDFLGRPVALFYAMGAAASQVLPVLEASKLALTVTVLSLPLGLLLLLLAARRDPFYAVLGFFPIYGTLMHWGFVNYLLGAGLYLATLAAVLLDLRRRRWWTAGLVVVGSFLVFFSHPYCLAVLVATAVPMVLVQVRGLGRAVRGLLPLAVCGLWTAIWFFWLSPPAPAGGEPWRVGLYFRRLGYLGSHLMSGLVGPEQFRAVWVFGGVVLGVVALSAPAFVRRLRARRRALTTVPDPLLDRTDLALAMPAAVNLMLFVVLPMSARGWWFIFPRHALFFALTLPLALPRLHAYRRWLAILAFAVVAAWPAIYAQERYQIFDRATVGFDDVVATIPMAQPVMALIPPTGEEPNAPLIHFGAYVRAVRGGYSAWSFSAFGYSPIYHPADRAPPRLPLRWEWRSTRLFALDNKYSRPYDHFLLGHISPEALFGNQLGEVEVVARSGAWSYVRRRELRRRDVPRGLTTPTSRPRQPRR